MSEMEQFIPQFPCLKHLELRAVAETFIADGNRWKTLVSSLITFHFKFNVLLLNLDHYFPSFRTPFWAEEKHWFVAYHDASLFSIPYFAPTHIKTNDLSDLSCTLPDRSLILNHVTQFTVNTKPIDNNLPLTHIKILELKQSTLLSVLQSVIDLTQVKHLVIPSLRDLLIFLPLENQIPQLNQLTIREQITKDMIEQFKFNRFQKIVKLRLNLTERDRHSIFEELFSLFPCVQYLRNHNDIQSMGTMIRLIDGFQSLVNASFYSDPPLFTDRLLSASDSTLRHPRRLAESNCTWRFYYISNKNAVYNWWIDSYSSDDRQLELPNNHR